MPDVLVRNVEDELLQGLKERAKSNGRSLQKELKMLFRSFVEETETLSSDETAAKIRNALRGRNHSDSAELLREDRQR
ncbi:MAG: hypothetical protein M3405_14175 [Acidobacteriota bacterium]|jgi:plasmid stability protein|nr:hypothetical protein [Acidobacteriota bacterium]